MPTLSETLYDNLSKVSYLSGCHDVHILPGLVVNEHVGIDLVSLVHPHILIDRTVTLAFQ